ncbi:MAG: alpha/beta fold hydrolase [Chlamydiota bacterium]
MFPIQLHTQSYSVNPEAPKANPLWERLASAYRRAIQSFVESQAGCFYEMAVMILGGILLEPWSALKTVLDMGLTWRKTLHSNTLNPLDLTPAQATQRPVLLIHGNYLNAATWLPLAKKLHKNHSSPVFTVDLPSGRLMAKDRQLLQDRIAHIQGVYRSNGFTPPPIDLVGHSRGGEAAKWLLASADKQSLKEIGKVILVGSEFSSSDLNQLGPLASRIHQLHGEHDIFIPKTSPLPPAQQNTVRVGHAGLLHSPKSHNQIIEWLKNG